MFSSAASADLQLSDLWGLAQGQSQTWVDLDRLSSYHLAVAALLCVLLLVAGQAVVAAVLLHEAPGSNGLLAAVAGEAVLMPAAALVLHLLGSWLEQREKDESFWLVLTQSQSFHEFIHSSCCS